MSKTKKQYLFLGLDAFSLLFFIGMLWFSFEKNLGDLLKYTWVFFTVLTIFNTIHDVRKVIKLKNSGL